MLLEYHFGDEIKLTCAYKEKALNWSNINAEDGKALSSYAHFLDAVICHKTWSGMEALNLICNLRLLASIKLLHKLRERWGTLDFDVLNQRKTRTTFCDLVKVMER